MATTFHPPKSSGLTIEKLRRAKEILREAPPFELSPAMQAEFLMVMAARRARRFKRPKLNQKVHR